MKNRQTIKGGAVFAGVAALLLISAAFSGPAWAITGGEPDGTRHPSVGAVIVYHPVYGIIPFFSGTLVHERVFLTAGHGVASILDGEVTLLGVSFDPELDIEHGTLLPVTQVVCSYNAVRPGADPSRTDIGVLILKDPVTNITPATLPTAGFLDDLKKARQLKAGPRGTRFTVVGYGWDLTWPPPEMIWPFEPIPVVYDGQTVLFWGGARNVAQSGYLGLNDGWLDLNQNLAAGYGGTANGDSGGPVFWTDPEGNEVLVSITAWGGSLVGNGWYYRIDTVESLQFIQDVIDSPEE